jgi:hypothetical protein
MHTGDSDYGTPSSRRAGYYFNLLLRVLPLPGDAVEFFVNTPDAVLGMLRKKEIVSMLVYFWSFVPVLCQYVSMYGLLYLCMYIAVTSVFKCVCMCSMYIPNTTCRPSFFSDSNIHVYQSIDSTHKV